MILVTGATGHLGTAVIQQLIKKAPLNAFAALARSEEKAAALTAHGVEVRIGDFDNPAGLASAFQGVDTLLLISTVAENRAEQQAAVVDAAKAAGVKHIAYTGVFMKDFTTAGTKDLMASHYATVDHIKASGLQYTIFENALYADVLPMFIGAEAANTGIFFPAGNGKAPFALRREMGEAIANALIIPTTENRTFALSSGTPVDFNQIATSLGEASGKEVAYTDIPDDAFRAQLVEMGLPDFVVFMSTGFAADIKASQFDLPSNDMENLLGRKPAHLTDTLKEVFGL